MTLNDVVRDRNWKYHIICFSSEIDIVIRYYCDVMVYFAEFFRLEYSGESSIDRPSLGSGIVVISLNKEYFRTSWIAHLDGRIKRTVVAGEDVSNADDESVSMFTKIDSGRQTFEI